VAGELDAAFAEYETAANRTTNLSERPGEMDISVRKNRQGRRGVVTTRMDSRLRYLPLTRDEHFQAAS
jgi:replicative DNA helicase